MRRVGTFEAKTHLSQLLDEVHRTGARIIIQRRGKDIAVLVPYEEAAEVDEGTKQWVLEGFRRLREKQEPLGPGETLKDFITDGRKR